MSTFNRGYTFNTNDLYIRTYNALGQPVTPFDIKFDISYTGTGTEIIVSDKRGTGGSDRLLSNIPASLYGNQYWASFDSISTWTTGTYRIRWKIKEIDINSPITYAIEDFEISPFDILVNDETTILSNLRNKLRIMLRDANPDRNYHFRPPHSSSILYNITKLSYVWEDIELDAFIQLSVGLVNMSPPRTKFNLLNIHSDLHLLLLQGACYLACRAVAVNWATDDFEYSLGSVSLNLSNKFSNYTSLADSFYNDFTNRLETYKSTVKITKTLINTPYTLPTLAGPYGFRAFFGKQY